MGRTNPTPAQRRRLFEANANRCCVCKENNIGFNLHHIDGNNSNTIDSNLAVLCVRDHDNHHRPQHYADNRFCHNLDAASLLRYKESWESFVEEAQKEKPKILAMLNVFGTEEFVHSMKLVMQWAGKNEIRNNRIEYEKIYHLHVGTHEDWIDDIIAEVMEIGNNIKLIVPDTPVDIEYCPCNNTSYSHTLDENIATKLTASDWDVESLLTIYINPTCASLALHVFYQHQPIYAGSLHVCNKQYLHFHSENIDERVRIKRKPSIRTQATDIIRRVISTWEPAQVFIGTGNPDTPELINEFILPKAWEIR